MTQLQPSLETSDEGALHRTASDVHSQSPSSAGFPEALYVKRVRPFAAQLQPRQFPSTSSLRYSSSLSTMRTVHHSAGPSLVETATTATGNQYATQGSGNNSPITALPPVTPPANVTLALEPIPRLSPDKRHGSRLIAWRAPSLDESDSKRNFLFGPLNRQIFLFCIGFVFPVAWWIAGVLPLPNRPRIQGPEMRESGVGEWSGSVVERDGGTRLDQAIDLFNVEEVRRYQEARWWRALNRVMSILGLLVVGAVVSLPPFDRVAMSADEATRSPAQLSLHASHFQTSFDSFSTSSALLNVYMTTITNDIRRSHLLHGYFSSGRTHCARRCDLSKYRYITYDDIYGQGRMTSNAPLRCLWPGDAEHVIVIYVS